MTGTGLKKIKRNKLLGCILFGIMALASGQENYRWELPDQGGIRWHVRSGDTHEDHIEMSGLSVSVIVRYGLVEGRLTEKLHLVFPMLRTLPNDTHASLSYDFDFKMLPALRIDGQAVEEHPTDFYINGLLRWDSETDAGLFISHILFPSPGKALVIDRITLENRTTAPMNVQIPELAIRQLTDASKGVDGAYVIEADSDKTGDLHLRPGEKQTFSILFSGRRVDEEPVRISPDYELRKREQFIEQTFTELVFHSPDPVLNRMFAFAKIRAAESIFETKGGLMHGPGGGSYYAAIWANDQAEYANPFFPFLGNPEGNESAINSFRHFARFQNDDFKPIPSSIIAEGLDFWNGAGDRGDMAMIAYGAARFALAYGDMDVAKGLWPLITWCLEYNRRKVNENGVVASDSDELEGRFPAGKANLNTSSLYYDALGSAAMLGEDLGKEETELQTYRRQAGVLHQAIEAFFGRKVAGFDTYRYYDGNMTLRSWICTPLTVGIFDRKKATIDALFSDRLWTSDGLATEAGSTTFWDRSTLYALRGVLAAGETGRAMEFLKYYSGRRLLGEHVPYAVEAYPEGNQRHLSAESALYARIITEGLFGIRPTGLRGFDLTPQLPENWDFMNLEHIHAFNRDFDVEVSRNGDQLKVRVFDKDRVYMEKAIFPGTTASVSLE